ncbi:putative tRNA/rRNA methyltransferase-like protein [Cryptosporidium canis]|uniref:tRNA/rRNA methyltransferase-like protein n=1 Tax=Cryptosporidium canis TaxID=195482 RepID=A0ABQ8P551_9CRYT|nr:putative tRNA/rRNA methyltransferase-like protein [Cryptosporidium canis]
MQDSTTSGKTCPEFYLVLSNISKRQNFGTLLRSACGFGVSEVLVVGEKKLLAFGNQGTLPRLSLTHYENINQVVDIVKEKEMDLVGIEISPDSKPIYPHPFKRSTAFILGNEGTGISQKYLNLCDYLIHIPLYGVGTASLNVAIAGSIVFHHFGLWAKFAESSKNGAKYLTQDEHEHEPDIKGKIRHYLFPSELGKPNILLLPLSCISNTL